jgi:hypothetical protein
MLRKLAVHILVEAEAADDSPLAPLVVKALEEFIAKTGPKSPATGKFESKDGLDVTWATKNEYFDDLGNLVNAEVFKRPIAEAVNDALSADTATKGNA